MTKISFFTSKVTETTYICVTNRVGADYDYNHNHNRNHNHTFSKLDVIAL